jgi:hypothetical protein
LVGLIKTMEAFYSFVEDSESIQNKVEVLENTYHQQNTGANVEFAVYIREYTDHRFRGECRTLKQIKFGHWQSLEVDY